MAYTYDDFTAAANKAGLLKDFTDSDLQIAKKSPEYGLSMLSLMKDGANATTEEQKLLATETANKLRKAYSGVGNTGFIGSYTQQVADAADKAVNYGPFDYSKENEYQQALKDVTEHGSFSYDYTQDPTYAATKKAYLREGERASANALARAAAASGGVPSSYAVSAATQAENNYAGKLGDLIPTLEQNAYQKYLGEFDRLRQVLSTLEGDRSKEYTDWTQEYNLLLDKLSNLSTLDQTEYQRYLKNLEQQAAEEAQRVASEKEAARLAQQQAEAAEAAKQEQLALALEMYEKSGYISPELAAALGIDLAKVQADAAEAERQRQQQAQLDLALEMYEASGYISPELAAALGINLEEQNTQKPLGETGGTTPPPIGETGDITGQSQTINLPGHGKLSPTGRTTQVEITTARGNKGLRDVPLHLAEDGTLWYLDPATQQYIKSEDYGVDYDSIRSLGYGDIDAERLDTLIRQGMVKEYLENGVYKYKRVYGGFRGGGGGYKSIEDRITT